MIPINRHRVWNLVADAALVATAWSLAFELRFDRGVPVYYHTLFMRTIAFVVAIKLAVFVLSGFYNRWWRYVSTRDMWGAARGVLVGSLIADLTVYFASPVHNVRLPRSIAVLDFLLTMAFIAASRMIARSIIERPQARNVLARGKEVIVVGAGDAARLMLREMLRIPALGYTPIGLIDDDPRKKNLRLEGVRVLGTIDDLAHVIRDNKPDELLIAIPSASGELRARVVDAAGDIPVKTLPGLHELIAGDLNLTTQIRPIQVEDVLGREPVEVDFESIASYVKDETVLVTGAGGSIGAELCRQIARVGPARLVLVEHSEAALFDIERELVGERDFSAVATAEKSRSCNSSRSTSSSAASECSTSTSRAGPTRAIWRQSSAPIEPPAPVTKTTSSLRYEAMASMSTSTASRPRRSSTCTGRICDTLTRPEMSSCRPGTVFTGTRACRAASTTRSRSSPGAEGIAIKISSGGLSRRTCGSSPVVPITRTPSSWMWRFFGSSSMSPIGV